jgi:hypothetical protein
MSSLLDPYQNVINPHSATLFLSVLRIRIHMFLGLLDPDPDPLVRGMDPDPSIVQHR